MGSREKGTHSYVESYRESSRTGALRVGKSTLSLLDDPDQINEWSDEDLIRGYRTLHKRDGGKGVHRGGRPPKVIPLVVHQELARRVLGRVRQNFMANLETAQEELFKILSNPLTEDGDRLRAIDMWMNRTLGKETQHIAVSLEAESPWRKIASVAIVGTAEQIVDGEEIVDGEIFEEEAVFDDDDLDSD